MAKEIDLSAFKGNTPPAPDLPPAGFARNEELARRTDKLEEAIETQTPEQYAIPHDHDALRPDRNREIQHEIHRGHLDIGHKHPVYAVKWVNWRNNEGSMVWQAKSDGWQVATPEIFPEAYEHGCVKEDNTLRVADVMLMCITHDKKLLLDARDKQKRLRQQYGVEADIHDLAAAANRKYKTEVFKNVQTPELTGLSESTLDKINARNNRQNAARRVAANSLGNRMKEGVIPGVPIR